MGKWYEEHLNFEIIREFGNNEGGAVFLKDTRSGTVIELFRLPEISSIKFDELNPIQLHLAIEHPNPLQLCERLVDAGAEMVGEAPKAEHQEKRYLVRDPWGFVLQILNRKNKLD